MGWSISLIIDHKTCFTSNKYRLFMGPTLEKADLNYLKKKEDLL